MSHSSFPTKPVASAAISDLNLNHASIWQEILSLDAKYNLNRNHNNYQLSKNKNTEVEKIKNSYIT